MKKLLFLFFLTFSTIAVQAQDSTAFQTKIGQVATKQYITVPTPSGSNLQLTGSWTLETWVYVPQSFNPFVQTYLIETYGFGPTGGYILRLNNQNVMAYQYASPLSNNVVVGSGAVTTGAWNHVAATMDTSLQLLSVYLNGVLDGSTPSSIATSNTNTELNIGARGDDRNITQPMILDEVRIWDFARTATDFAGDMNQCLTGNEPGLVLYYNFEGITNLAVADKSGNSNTGTISNFDTLCLKGGIFACPTTVAVAREVMNLTKLYPNPASHTLRIQTATPIIYVEVFDLLGKKVLESRNAEINVEGLGNGVYLMRATTEAGIVQEKFIKK